MPFINDFMLSHIKYAVVTFKRNSVRSQRMHSDVFLGYFCREHIVILLMFNVKHT